MRRSGVFLAALLSIGLLGACTKLNQSNPALIAMAGQTAQEVEIQAGHAAGHDDDKNADRPLQQMLRK